MMAMTIILRSLVSLVISIKNKVATPVPVRLLTEPFSGRELICLVSIMVQSESNIVNVRIKKQYISIMLFCFIFIYNFISIHQLYMQTGSRKHGGLTQQEKQASLCGIVK